MPNPDGTIENANLADNNVTTRTLDDELTTVSFTATAQFTGPYETSVAAADTPRITLDAGVLRGFTGDSGERSPGVIKTVLSGSGDSSTLQTNMWAPSFLDSEGGVFLVIRSASFDDSNSPSGWVFGTTGASTQTPELSLQDGVLLRLNAGSDMIMSTSSELVIPALTSDPSSPADGNMWLHTVDNALYIWEGGSRRTVASW